MYEKVRGYLKELIERYPILEKCENEIVEAYNILKDTFLNDGKLLLAGNGGSCSDCEHIVGELMKSFKRPRNISSDFSKKIKEIDFEKGQELEKSLQLGLPCISLTNHQSLNTAFMNDVENGGIYIYAQQINVYGNENDTFLAISTSGNAKNIYYACLVAKAKGMKIIGLSGEDGGLLNKVANVIIRVPYKETYVIQEYHLPIYHCLCLMLEETFFCYK